MCAEVKEWYSAGLRYRDVMPCRLLMPSFSGESTLLSSNADVLYSCTIPHIPDEVKRVNTLQRRSTRPRAKRHGTCWGRLGIELAPTGAARMRVAVVVGGFVGHYSELVPVLITLLRVNKRR